MGNVRRQASLNEETKNEILSSFQEQLEKGGFAQEDFEPYLAKVASVLDFYQSAVGAEAKLRYRVRKRFGRVEVRLTLKAAKLNPFENDADGEDIGKAVQRAFAPFSRGTDALCSHAYISGTNIVTVTSPRIQRKGFGHSPMLWSSLLGLACGFLCLYLPEDIRNVIVFDIVRPVQSLCLDIMAGVMVPVLLISMISAISALGNIDALSDLGLKVIGRFLIITLAVMAVCFAVCLCFYSVMGSGGVGLNLGQIVDLLLGIIPTSVFAPLVEGNYPQVVILGVVLGAALLVLENQVDGLKDFIGEVHLWVMSFMDLVMTIVPIVPFCCIMSTIAKGAGADLLDGWGFIVAVYLASLICGVIKLAIVSIKFKVKPALLLRKLKPMVGTAFASANTSLIMKQEYEIARDDLGIEPEFSSFWIPLAEAMFYTRGTILLVIPPFFIMKSMGMPITGSTMLLLIILGLELSMASPGTTGAWTILFAALGFPSDFVGIYMTYKLACANFNAGYGALEMGLEQIAAAAKFDAINLDKLRDEGAKDAVAS